MIGAGFGGLALAIRLQSAGFDVQLLEKRDRAGGRAYVYEQDGFVFDAGPTVLTDPACLDELFGLTGRKLSDYVELVPVTPFYRLLWSDGTRFDYSNDDAALDRQIGEIEPRDVAGYRRFHEYAREVYREGYLKLGSVAFPDIASMVRVAPSLLRLRAWRSVYGIVSRFVRDRHLREALSFHTLLIGGSPFRTSAIYTLIHALERESGVWWARGGTGQLVQALVRLFTELGGTIRTGCEVESIRMQGDRATGVRLRGGEEIASELVASNGDVVHTYGTLLRDHPRGRAMGKRLRKRRHSMSLFVVYFGLRRPASGVAHHTILFGPRYRELVKAIFAGHRLRDDFSLYLHAPSVTDDSLAPPGCSTWYVLAPVPNLDGDVDWATEAPRYAELLIDQVEATLLPGLRRDLVTCRVFTPEDFAQELNAHAGSAFSLEPTLTQSAWFRVHNRDDAIRNLYFVGAGTHPGAGVPGVVASAKATAAVILQRAEGQAA